MDGIGAGSNKHRVVASVLAIAGFLSHWTKANYGIDERNAIAFRDASFQVRNETNLDAIA